MKVGDLVRCPPNDTYWWSERLGLIVSIDDTKPNGVARVLVGDVYCKFGINYLEFANESR